MRRFRFRPPAVAIPADLAWLLRRAFGPLADSIERPVPSAVAELALRLDLAPRLAARVGRERLAAELGADGASPILAQHRRAVARDLALAGVARDVVDAAKRRDIPVVFLKGTALGLGGWTMAGARPAADVDALAPAARLEDLQSELVVSGYRPASIGYEHHLPALSRPGHGAIELHRVVPGVRLAKGGSADWAALQAAGLLRRVDAWEAAWIPVRSVLAAHALAHGLGQHGFAPRAYSQMTMLGDLLDLGLGDRDGEGLAARCAPWIEDVVSPEEVAAARELAACLAAGDRDVFRDPPERTPARVLLDHCLAGRLDPRYEGALKLRMFAHPLSERWRFAATAAGLWRAIFPSAGELATLYGPRRSRFGRWVLRCRRPLDLTVRLLRYTSDAVALRLRPRR